MPNQPKLPRLRLPRRSQLLRMKQKKKLKSRRLMSLLQKKRPRAMLKTLR